MAGDISTVTEATSPRPLCLKQKKKVVFGAFVSLICTTQSGEGLIWAGDTSWMYYKATANLRAVGSGASLIFFKANSWSI